MQPRPSRVELGQEPEELSEALFAESAHRSSGRESPAVSSSRRRRRAGQREMRLAIVPDGDRGPRRSSCSSRRGRRSGRGSPGSSRRATRAPRAGQALGQPRPGLRRPRAPPRARASPPELVDAEAAGELRQPAGANPHLEACPAARRRGRRRPERPRRRARGRERPRDRVDVAGVPLDEQPPGLGISGRQRATRSESVSTNTYQTPLLWIWQSCGHRSTDVAARRRQRMGRALGRIGLVAKGVSFAIVGVLALLVAFGAGGAATDRQGRFAFFRSSRTASWRCSRSRSGSVPTPSGASRRRSSTATTRGTTSRAGRSAPAVSPRESSTRG